MDALSSGCKTIDLLLAGGLPLGAPAVLFGIPDLGKTWLCFQFACNCTRLNKNGGLDRPVLYLDTESFFREADFKRFYSYFRKRWSDLPVDPRIDMIRVPDLFKLGKLFGMQIRIVQEESRVSALIKFPTSRQIKLAQTKSKKKGDVVEVKETYQSDEWQKESEIWKRFEEKNYGLLVIDSLAIPIKSKIPKGTQHLPGRGTIINALLGVLYPIAQEFNCAILLTTHITASPMSPIWKYGGGDPWGGRDVRYYLKFQSGLFPPLKDDRESGPDGSRIRRITRHRFPGMDQTLVRVMLAKDQGYIDIPAGRVRQA